MGASPVKFFCITILCQDIIGRIEMQNTVKWKASQSTCIADNAFSRNERNKNLDKESIYEVII